MDENKFLMFRNRLKKVYRHLAKHAKRLNVSCFRIYNHDLPEFPFCIEIYEDRLYVAEYKRKFEMTEELHEQWLQQCCAIMHEVLSVPTENIFIKLRKRKEGRLDQYQKLETEKNEFIVEENGLKFIVNLSDYLDTGLFLDHRLTREMVRKQSAGKKVLNLFAYTGSFSVYAAAGGAEKVVTVDLSKTYIGWAERNFEINGFPIDGNHEFIQADVLQYLEQIQPSSFDIIVMDPPTFSNSKRMNDFLDIQRDHVRLINQCIAALTPGGVLYFSTNYSKFELNDQAIQSKSIKNITKATTPFDFEGKLNRYCFSIEK